VNTNKSGKKEIYNFNLYDLYKRIFIRIFQGYQVKRLRKLKIKAVHNYKLFINKFSKIELSI